MLRILGGGDRRPEDRDRTGARMQSPGEICSTSPIARSPSATARSADPSRRALSSNFQSVALSGCSPLRPALHIHDHLARLGVVFQPAILVPLPYRMTP